MNCSRCGENEATVHETRIENGKIVEVHLCAGCAGQTGIDHGGGAGPEDVLDLFLSSASEDLGAESEDDSGSAEGGSSDGGEQDVEVSLDVALPAEVPLAPRIARPSGPCPSCGCTFEQFKESGRLGCAACYEHFEPQLTPLLERAHDGGSRHIGKVPARSLGSGAGEDAGGRMERLLGDQRDIAERVVTLQRQLAQALAGEHFERASQIRDELRQLGAEPSPLSDAGDRGEKGDGS